MSSARSNSSAAQPAPQPYKSKVGILPSSLPAYHRDFIERAKAGGDSCTPRADALEEPAGARPETAQEEAARRLKPHSRNSQLRLDEAGRRPHNLTPTNPTKKTKPVRWQFGIRSRNAPWEALLCIHKALHKLGATYLPDENYDNQRAQGGEAERAESDAGDDYGGAPLRRFYESANSADPKRRYRLPADPWRIKVRWETPGKSSPEPKLNYCDTDVPQSWVSPRSPCPTPPRASATTAPSSPCT